MRVLLKFRCLKVQGSSQAAVQKLMQELKFAGVEQTYFIYLTRNTPGAKFGIQKLFHSTL